jgi:hypothetical protein
MRMPPCCSRAAPDRMELRVRQTQRERCSSAHVALRIALLSAEISGSPRPGRGPHSQVDHCGSAECVLGVGGKRSTLKNPMGINVTLKGVCESPIAHAGGCHMSPSGTPLLSRFSVSGAMCIRNPHGAVDARTAPGVPYARSTGRPIGMPCKALPRLMADTPSKMNSIPMASPMNHRLTTGS